MYAGPVQRHRPQHGIAERLEQGERLGQGVLQPVDLTHPGGGHPQLAKRQQRKQVHRVFGEHLDRRIPMLLHRTAVAAAPGDRRLQRGGPQRVAAVQRRIGRRGDIGGRSGQLSVEHPDPAEQQSVPVGRKGLVCRVRLAACAHRPADHAAGAHRVAAVQRGQRHQCGGGVRCDARWLLFGGDRMPKPRDGDRVRLIQRQQQTLCEAACGARG